MKMLKQQTQQVNLENLRLRVSHLRACTGQFLIHTQLQIAEMSQRNLAGKATTVKEETDEEAQGHLDQKRKQTSKQQQDGEDDDLIEMPPPLKKQKEDVLVDLTDD
jgi:hypothetical protein